MRATAQAAPLAWARIIFAALLIGLQAAVVLTGWFWPDASPDYSATYITHRMDCWLPPGTPPFLPSADVIVPRALPANQACALLPKGWNPKDTTNVWSNGRIARLDIPLRPGDALVTLRLQGYSQHVTQSVEILQAHAAAMRLQIPPNTIAQAQFPVPPGMTILHLKILIAQVHHPLDRDIIDWRAIGIAVLDITRTPEAKLHDHATPS